MLSDGLKLMVLGMGWVFVFLALMVLFISVAAKLLAPLAGVLEEKPAAPKNKAGGARDAKEKNMIAAAVAAVQMHRARKK